MIRIAIVDDEKNMLDIIERIVIETIGDNGQIEIVKYIESEVFLKEMLEGKSFDVLLSDIQMEKLNGMELSHRIREAKSKMYIIFITSYREYAVDSFKVDAYQYIMKEDLQARLPVIINRLIHKIQSESKEYRVFGTEEKVKVYCKDIIYIYKCKAEKYVCFVTLGGDYRERTTMQQVYQELKDSKFIEVTRGLIVNVNHIQKFRGDMIYMENDYEIKVSRSKLTEAKKQINSLWGV